MDLLFTLNVAETYRQSLARTREWQSRASSLGPTDFKARAVLLKDE